MAVRTYEVGVVLLHLLTPTTNSEISGQPLWFHRYIAGPAMEVDAVLGINDLEAMRDEIDGWRDLVVLREASLASLAAVRTSQVFVPLVFHGGPPYAPRSVLKS